MSFPSLDTLLLKRTCSAQIKTIKTKKARKKKSFQLIMAGVAGFLFLSSQQLDDLLFSPRFNSLLAEGNLSNQCAWDFVVLLEQKRFWCHNSIFCSAVVFVPFSICRLDYYTIVDSGFLVFLAFHRVAHLQPPTSVCCYSCACYNFTFENNNKNAIGSILLNKPWELWKMDHLWMPDEINFSLRNSDSEKKNVFVSLQ